jgi:predicted dehydrogenase
VESFYGYNLGGPFGQALLQDPGHWVHQLPGRLLHNVIDHMLNKMAEFVPDETPVIRAVGSVLRPQRLGDERDRMHDELRLLVQGRKVSGYGTFSAHVRPVAQFVRLYGTKNIAHVDYVGRTVTLQADATLPSAIGRVLPGIEQGLAFLREGGRNILRFVRSDFHFFAGLKRHLELFYDAILEGRPPPVAYRDILRIATIMDTIFAELGSAEARP